MGKRAGTMGWEGKGRGEERRGGKEERKDVENIVKLRRFPLTAHDGTVLFTEYEESRMRTH